MALFPLPSKVYAVTFVLTTQLPQFLCLPGEITDTHQDKQKCYLPLLADDVITLQPLHCTVQRLCDDDETLRYPFKHLK